MNEDERYKAFVNKLKPVFDFFESNKKIPLIGINKKGDYEMLSATIQQP